MTTASTTATAQTEIHEAGHVDVLIVGAGVSGIGAAHHLREQFPGRTFVILDAQDNRGGTWWTHRYPGVRSDSDLFTYGYRFKPWRGPAIAAGGEILAYLDEVIDEDDLAPHIRYQHRVTAASWSTADRRWTVEVTRERHRAAAALHRRLPDDVPGLLQPRQALQARVGGHGPLPGRDRAPAAVAGGPRPGRQARHRHRLRRHGRDADPRDRREGGARDDAAALALLLLRAAGDRRARRAAARPGRPRGVDARDPAPQVHGADQPARPDVDGVARRAARVPHRVDAPAAARGLRHRQALHPALPPLAAAHRRRPGR